MTRIGIVTGLAAEATIVRKTQISHSAAADAAAIEVVCLGPGSDRSESAAAMLAAEGAKALISFGVAGALDASLSPGAIVIASRIVDESGTTHQGDEDWASRLAALAGDSVRVAVGIVAGSASPIAGAAAKAALGTASGALAVDMESAGVGRAAGRAGLPFIVVRAIADPADRAIPQAALAGLRADGGADVLAVLKGAVRRPGDVPGLMALARDQRRALRALRDLALAAGPGFGLV